MAAGGDAAPAGVARSHALGRPREPTGRHHDRSARSSLDWDWHVASSQEARTRGRCLRLVRRRETAMERREAPAFLATGTRQDGKTGAPPGAPSPRFMRGEKRGRRRIPRRKEQG